MTGLNLEGFLRLFHADAAFWTGAASVAVFLGLGIWAARGRTPILSRCLILSLAAHLGIVLYSGPRVVNWLVPTGHSETAERILRRDAPPTTVSLMSETVPSSTEPEPTAELDRPEPAAPLDTVPVPEYEPPAPLFSEPEREPLAAAPQPLATPAPDPETPAGAELTERAVPPSPEPAGESGPVDPREQARVVVADASTREESLPDLDPAEAGPAPVARPGRRGARVEPVRGAAPETANLAPASPPRAREVDDPTLSPDSLVPTGGNDEIAAPAALAAGPEPAVPELGAPGRANRATPTRARSDTVPLMRETPAINPPPVAGRPGPAASTRPLPDIPDVYRSRMGPNRSAIALAGGASAASEQAVERALAWLAAHQDADGRWNAGTRKGSGGDVLRGEASFTAHCPPNELCAGEAYYWEADTAMTGLALLAFLGAGQTHQSGQHAVVVTRGLNYLIRTQKPDGDLRGASINVGLYCHAIASLALCEAYALTHDAKLRGPVERAVKFLVDSRTSDKLAWRYQPHDRHGGDTSILGWAVMVVKSARNVDIQVPDDVRQGVLLWLRRVSEGPANGLALYRPGDGYPVTPTMTAEAWVCRQFMGVGGPGDASDEAASYLLQHGPDRDPFNLYYWYYGTLAMFQHGGDPWARWNSRVRDELVRRQARGGHADGSWDPAQCKDKHDVLGGRVYTTAVATLTLEVYYRYLRLYDAPSDPTPANLEIAPGADAALRRVGIDPAATPAAP